MAIQMLCPCGTRLTVRGSAPGQLIECSNCGQRLRIPAPSGSGNGSRAPTRPQVQAEPPRQVTPEVVHRGSTSGAGKARAAEAGMKAWPIIAGFVGMLAAVGGVYYVMNQRVGELEAALDMTAEATVSNAEEAKAQLAEEQTRASAVEGALRASVEKQERAQQALAAEFRLAAVTADGLREKIELEVARLEAAREAGDAKLALEHERAIEPLRTKLATAIAERDKLGTRLDAVNLALGKLKDDLLDAEIDRTRIEKESKEADDQLLKSLNDQQKRVAKLTARLGSARGTKQIQIRRDLDQAQQALRDLEAKVAAAPPNTELLQLTNRLSNLETQRATGALTGTGARVVATGTTGTGSSVKVHLLSLDSASGAALLTVMDKTSGPAATIAVAEGTSPAPGGSDTGRYQALASLDSSGKLEEFFRLDVLTGTLWHIDANATPTWRRIRFFQPSGSNGPYRLELGDSSVRASPPLMTVPSQYRTRRVIVLTDLKTGGVFTDWVAPRMFVQ